MRPGLAARVVRGISASNMYPERTISTDLPTGNSHDLELQGREARQFESAVKATDTALSALHNSRCRGLEGV
jgi:hypothetical protein